MTTTRRVRHRARPQAEEGKGPSGGRQRVVRGMGAPSAARMEAMLARAAGAAREGAGGVVVVGGCGLFSTEEAAAAAGGVVEPPAPLFVADVA